jgi:hypothetical protein
MMDGASDRVPCGGLRRRVGIISPRSRRHDRKPARRNWAADGGAFGMSGSSNRERDSIVGFGVKDGVGS